MKTKTTEKECKHHGKTIFVLESSGYYRCRQCRMDNVSASRRKTKVRALEYLGGKCSKCGYKQNTAALEFHHLDDKKEFSISGNGACLNWDRVLEELSKCILLCSNCHREHHNPQLNISKE